MLAKLLFILIATGSCLTQDPPDHIENVAFIEIGSYRSGSIFEGSTKKTYFIPRYFIAPWANSRSICKAYGMDVLSLDTEDEANHFLGLLESNSDLFTQWTFVGALTLVGGSTDSWYWVNSGNRVTYPIKFGVGEPSFTDNMEFCLSVGKYGAPEFHFNDIPCHEGLHYKFFCQQQEALLEKTTMFESTTEE